jgi:hypothetical protein
MSISNIVITVAVVVWLIVRQLQVRPVLVRQGNAVTVVLWIIGLALHIGIDLVLRRTTTAADQLGSVSLLLYLAVTVAAQRWVVTGKAARLTPA